MRKFSLLLLLCVAAPALAQPPFPVFRFPQPLKDYLGLSDAQVDSINRLNGDYNSFVFQKTTRMAQVQREIGDVTNADPIDPMAIGLRYAEIEAIRRDLR